MHFEICHFNANHTQGMNVVGVQYESRSGMPVRVFWRTWHGCKASERSVSGAGSAAPDRDRIARCIHDAAEAAIGNEGRQDQKKTKKESR
jgi:hypothetical protein